MKKVKNNKTYVVYQDKYSRGYGVYDPDPANDDQFDSKLNEFDVIEQFEAEEGAEWFGYLTESIHIKKEWIEDEGYTVEQLEKMSRTDGTELYNAVYKCLPDPEKEFSDWENGAGITECDEDKPNDAYDFEDSYGDWFVVIVEVKYKFTMSNGEVKYERVK